MTVTLDFYSDEFPATEMMTAKGIKWAKGGGNSVTARLYAFDIIPSIYDANIVVCSQGMGDG